VNIVVKSLLSGNAKKLTESFDFDAFTELVPESCIVNELIGAFTEASPTRFNKAFYVEPKEEVRETQPIKHFTNLVKYEVNLADIIKPI
jgi:hypothetical protein